MNTLEFLMAAAYANRRVGEGHNDTTRDDRNDSVNDWLWFDTKCGICADKYPRSALHFLIFPREIGLKSLNSLTSRDASLIEHMAQVAKRLCDALRAAPSGEYDEAFPPGSLPLAQGSSAIVTAEYLPSPDKARFAVGFQAIPTVPMLSLDIVSLDFCGRGLKQKSQYNRVASPYLLPPNRIVEDLRKHGRVTANQDIDTLKALELQKLRCSWCGIIASRDNVADLHYHFRRCENMAPGLRGELDPVPLIPEKDGPAMHELRPHEWRPLDGIDGH